MRTNERLNMRAVPRLLAKIVVLEKLTENELENTAKAGRTTAHQLELLERLRCVRRLVFEGLGA